MARAWYTAVLCVGIILAGPSPSPAADAVVGSGTPASCTEAALDGAVATVVPGGGTITFNCGGVATIALTTHKLFFHAPNPYLTYTIDGGGSITLSGGNVTRHIFHMSGTLNVRNITLTGGRAAGIADQASGAAIRSDRDVTWVPNPVMALNLTNVTFTNNATNLTGWSAPYSQFDYGGGAVFARLINLTVVNSTFSGNAANNSAGGAIHGRSSTIAISGSMFQANTSNGGGFGGAIHVDGLSAAGANGTMAISASRFSGNTSLNQGGAIYFFLYPPLNESVTLDTVSVTGNHVVDSGVIPFVGNRGIGGGLAGDGGNLTIRNSTFANNTARGQIATGGGGAGGGISSYQNGTVTITNSTLSGNQAIGNNSDASGGGLVIYNNTQPFQIIHSTIAYNQSGWTGGGIQSTTAGVLINTVVAHNTAANPGFGSTIQQQCSSQLTNGGGAHQYPDVVGQPSALNPRCAAGVIVSNPQILGLADNGGFTLTHHPGGGSPLVNTATCEMGADQRGVARPQGGSCDLGAVEALATAATRQDLLVDFGTLYGVWSFQTGVGWQSVHGLSPELMLTADLDGNGLDDVVFDFGSASGVWAWMNHAVWVQLHGLSPSRMAAGDLDGNGQSDIVFDFPGLGVWRRSNNTTWSQLHVLNAQQLGVGQIDGSGGDDVILNFAGAGLWTFRNNSTWTLIHPFGVGVAGIVAADLDGNGQDEVVVEFPGYGIWKYQNNATWMSVHPFSPAHLAAGNLDGNAVDDLIVDFGAATGIWTLRNGTTWQVLHASTADGIAVGDLDGSGRDEVVIDFGTSSGLWQYRNDASWELLHGLNPDGVTTGHVY